MRYILLTMILLTLAQSASADVILAPGELEAHVGDDQTTLTWTLPVDDAHGIQIDRYYYNGTIDTVDIAGDPGSYVDYAEGVMMYTMTYLKGATESLPSAPASPWPYCTENAVGLDWNAPLIIVLNSDCWCPTPGEDLCEIWPTKLLFP